MITLRIHIRVDQFSLICPRGATQWHLCELNSYQATRQYKKLITVQDYGQRETEGEIENTAQKDFVRTIKI
jgi:hypothetical protein